MAFVPAFDLTTLFEVILAVSFLSPRPISLHLTPLYKTAPPT